MLQTVTSYSSFRWQTLVIACTLHTMLNSVYLSYLQQTITTIRLDAFVMGAGTGGCLAGVSQFLRGKKSTAKVYLVDPPGSALFNRVRYGVCYSPQMSERDVRKHRCGHPFRKTDNALCIVE